MEATLYAWQEQDERGEWGTIVAGLPDPFKKELHIDAPTVLVFRSKEVVEHLRPLAVAHCKASGNPVRLAEFKLENVLVELSSA